MVVDTCCYLLCRRPLSVCAIREGRGHLGWYCMHCFTWGPTRLLPPFEVCSTHPRWKALICENTHTAQTALVFLHLKLFHRSIVPSQDSGILFLALSSTGLCSVFRAQTFLESVGTVLSPCVLRRPYSERKVVVCPDPTRTARR